MTEKNIRLRLLFQKYITRTASPRELQEFYDHVLDPSVQEYVEDLLTEELDKQDQNKELYRKNADQILANIFAHEKRLSVARIKKRPTLWWRIGSAAAIVLMVGIGWATYLQKANTERLSYVKQITKLDEITRFANTQVYLIRSDGERIILPEGKSEIIDLHDGITLIKSIKNEITYSTSFGNDNGKRGDYHTLEIPKGSQFNIVLHDGTKVSLNAGSSLRFPSAFARTGERKVYLEGEGYFDVAKDKKRPFIVQTADQQKVEVLGTIFNINAYNRDNIKTTLIEGKVRVVTLQAHNKGKTVVLKPGQMSLIDHETIVVSNVSNHVDWKEGYFVFNDLNIREIMNELANWYDFDIYFQGDMSDVSFHGNYLRSRDVHKLFKSLELTKRIRFEIDGRRIKVIKIE